MNQIETIDDVIKPFITVRSKNGASRVFTVSVEQHWGDFRLTLMNDDGEIVFKSDWEMIVEQQTINRAYAECTYFLQNMKL